VKTPLCILAAVVLLAGCSRTAEQQRQAARIAELEGNDVRQLQHIIDLATLVQRDEQDFRELQTNFLSLGESVLQQVSNTDNCAKDILHLAEIVDKLLPPARAASVRPVPAPAPATKGGVPADVYAGIRADAQNLYPRNFDMQEFVIKQQSNAWLRLHGQQ
jgi:hypothetical protein